MWEWLNGKGEVYKEAPTDGYPKYMGGEFQPFQHNPHFKSQPVLSEELREEIWRRIMKEQIPITQVSRDFGVDMHRIGAVVRLKELEKKWEAEGKKLAKPYAKAIMGMLPQTPYDPKNPVTHEGINDLAVHKATTAQIFYPTSESRVFSRQDAARIFNPTLLPADERIPHPEMIEMAKDEIDGLSWQEMQERIKERDAEDQERRVLKRQQVRERQEKVLTRVESPRWEFRFKEISVDEIGRDGRGAHATGYRYGAPHMDRKRAQVKIPKRVV